MLEVSACQYLNESFQTYMSAATSLPVSCKGNQSIGCGLDTLQTSVANALIGLAYLLIGCAFCAEVVLILILCRSDDDLFF